MGRLPSLRTCQASHKDGPTISKPDLLQSMVKEVLKSRKSPIACTEKHGEQWCFYLLPAFSFHPFLDMRHGSPASVIHLGQTGPVMELPWVFRLPHPLPNAETRPGRAQQSLRELRRPPHFWRSRWTLASSSTWPPVFAWRRYPMPACPWL